MDDLISRQAAIDAIVNTISEIGYHDNSEVARYGATFRQHEIIDIIENLPTAEPKTGRWKKTGAYPHKVYCSVCYATYVPNSELESWSMKKDSFWKLPRNYCPNCGARMEG